MSEMLRAALHAATIEAFVRPTYRVPRPNLVAEWSYPYIAFANAHYARSDSVWVRRIIDTETAGLKGKFT
jgi:hypothetical protein